MWASCCNTHRHHMVDGVPNRLPNTQCLSSGHVDTRRVLFGMEFLEDFVTKDVFNLIPLIVLLLSHSAITSMSASSPFRRPVRDPNKVHFYPSTHVHTHHQHKAQHFYGHDMPTFMLKTPKDAEFGTETLQARWQDCKFQFSYSVIFWILEKPKKWNTFH